MHSGALPADEMEIGSRDPSSAPHSRTSWGFSAILRASMPWALLQTRSLHDHEVHDGGLSSRGGEFVRDLAAKGLRPRERLVIRAGAVAAADETGPEGDEGEVSEIAFASRF